MKRFAAGEDTSLFLENCAFYAFIDQATSLLSHFYYNRHGHYHD
jgi:hypothetical protein